MRAGAATSLRHSNFRSRCTRPRRGPARAPPRGARKFRRGGPRRQSVRVAPVPLSAAVAPTYRTKCSPLQRRPSALPTRWPIAVGVSGVRVRRAASHTIFSRFATLGAGSASRRRRRSPHSSGWRQAIRCSPRTSGQRIPARSHASRLWITRIAGESS